MTDTNSSRPTSRLAQQPAPTPLSPSAQISSEPRPTYGELQSQGTEADYSALSTHLNDETRALLSLPLQPTELRIGQAERHRIRVALLAHPEHIVLLSDVARALLAL